MKESAFWRDVVRPNLIRSCDSVTYPLHLQRIENGVGAGQADVNAVYMGTEIWIELKVMKGTQIEIRFSQILWAHSRHKANVSNMFVMALHKERVKVWRHSTLLNMGANGSTLNNGRVTKKSICFVPPCPDYEITITESWDGLKKFLFSS